MKTKTKTKRKPVVPEFELYKDSKNEWRWRVVKRGEVICVSSEGYKRKSSCIKGALITKQAINFTTWTTTWTN
jgi:uncharacterized protein